jgi:hypothetical protein
VEVTEVCQSVRFENIYFVGGFGFRQAASYTKVELRSILWARKASASPHFFANLPGFAQTQHRCEVLLI